jgi:hypothetical protein
MVEQLVDLRHHLRAGLAHLPRAQRQRERQGRGGAASEANVSGDLWSFAERHVVHEKSHHALALAIGRRRLLPKLRQIGGEREDARALRLIENGFVALASALVFLLGAGESTELPVPLGLEFVGHQTIVGIDLHEAPARQVSLVSRSLHLARPKPFRLVSARLDLLLHGEGGLKRHRRHRLDEEASDGLIDVGARDALAERLGARDASALTGVRR